MNRTGRIAGLVCLLVASLGGAALAQDEPTNDELLERLRRLEEEVERLRGEEQAPEPEAAPAPTGDFEFDPDFQPPQDFRFDPEAAARAKEGRGESSEEPSWLTLRLPWSTQLTVSGSVRSRGEYRAPASYQIPGTFGRPATDDSADGTDFALLRTRVALTFRVVEQLQARVELQDSRRWGDTAAGADVAEVHLRKGYLVYSNAFGQPLTIKVGRWAVPRLGDQRLITDPEFNNVGRSWDGVQVEYRPTACLEVLAFAANVRESLDFSNDGDENDDFWFTGLHVSWSPILNHEFQLYVFWRHLGDRVFNAERSTRLGDRKDFTFGGRFAGERCGWDYSVELTMQWGDQAGDRIRAYAGAARLGFTQPLDDERAIGAHVEVAYASGDRDPTDGQLQTFDPLVPARVRHHGWMNLLAYSNMQDVELGLKLVPFARLSLHVEGHAFWLDKRKDGWFDPSPAVVRRDPSGASRSFLGYEVDSYARYSVFDRLFFLAGYGHFFPGDYVRDSAQAGAGVATQDQGWLFGQVELKF